jgi:peptidoglycan/LPS O-acetylase OafA/YrhL
MPPPIPGGNLGVSVFFVLSGYVITALLTEDFDRCGQIDLRAFYVRRGSTRSRSAPSPP